VFFRGDFHAFHVGKNAIVGRVDFFGQKMVLNEAASTLNVMNCFSIWSGGRPKGTVTHQPTPQLSLTATADRPTCAANRSNENLTTRVSSARVLSIRYTFSSTYSNRL
jgi:hypothetical protein